MKEKDLEQLSEKVLSLAQGQGATSAEVTVGIETGFNVTARLGEVETIEFTRDRGIGLTVYFDHQTGSASSTDLSHEALQAAVEKACNIARFTSSDPDMDLADNALMAYGYPDLSLNFPWTISPDQALDMMIECENLARSQDSRITNSDGASLSTHQELQVYANTHGFIGSYWKTHHSLNCVLIAEQQDQMQRDYEYTAALDPSDLDDINLIAQKAAAKTVQRLGARRLKTQSAPVIFLAPVARGLLGHFVQAISGGSIYRKSSFLVDHLQKPIFPRIINIYQRPHLPKALGSLPFDQEGVKTTNRDFIKDGILQSYILSSYSARKLGMHSTGNAGGIQNLLIDHLDIDLTGLIMLMGKGLLVTELIGQGINIVTGDYSRGAFGFWIENGEIQYPVHEITIASNLKNMFMNIVAVANDVDHRGSILSGSILVDQMMIAGE